MTAENITEFYSFYCTAAAANRRDDSEGVAMKFKHALAAAETRLKGVSVQLENAEHDLRTLRATINRTNETIRTSREAIVRTNTLVQPGETLDKDVEASSLPMLGYRNY